MVGMWQCSAWHEHCKELKGPKDLPMMRKRLQHHWCKNHSPSLPNRILSMMVLHCQENILDPWASECICTSQGSNDVEMSSLLIWFKSAVLCTKTCIQCICAGYEYVGVSWGYYLVSHQAVIVLSQKTVGKHHVIWWGVVAWSSHFYCGISVTEFSSQPWLRSQELNRAWYMSCMVSTSWVGCNVCNNQSLEVVTGDNVMTTLEPVRALFGMVP